MYLFAAIDIEVAGAPDYLLLDLDIKACAFVKRVHAKYLAAAKDENATLSLKVDASAIRHCWLRYGDERLNGTVMRREPCGAGEPVLWEKKPWDNYLAEELPEGFNWKNSESDDADFDWSDLDLQMSIGENYARFSGNDIGAGSFLVSRLTLWAHPKGPDTCPLCGEHLETFTWYCKELTAIEIELTLDEEGDPRFKRLDTEGCEDDEYLLCLCPHCNGEFRPEEIGLSPNEVEW